MGSQSVKGSLVLGAAVAVRRLRDRGRLRAEELEVRLSPEAMALLDQKIAIARWYPAHAFRELVELDWEVSGGRDPAYLVELGAQSAARMFDSRMYQQLDYAERTKKAGSRGALLRQARLVTTITGTLYDFLEFAVNLGAKELEIVFRNTAPLGEAALHTTLGFMNQINERQGSKRRWTGHRPNPDEIHFTVVLPRHLASEE